MSEYILKSDAIKAIQKYGIGCLDADDFSPEQCERFVINKINELPSVTPLPQEQSRDMKEIKEVINCGTDAETKCKMISNILNAKPHYFKEPQESEK